MKKSKFNLGFTLLAATSLLTVSACSKPEPLTADNDFACRDQQGKIVDEDHCDSDDGDGTGTGMLIGGALMYMMMSSNQYSSSHGGRRPSGYNARSYAGKTTKSFSQTNRAASKGGFGSTARGKSSGS